MADDRISADSGPALFVGLVDAAEAMRALRRICAEHPAVVPDQVLLTTDLREYAGSPTYELYVDAESRAGRGYAWCWELRREGVHWILERAVRLNDKNGQRTLLDLGPVEFDSTENLASRLPHLTRELVETFSKIEIA